MKKLRQLYRLDFAHAMLELKYLLKRVFRLKITNKEWIINDYYFHLIFYNGFWKKESNDYFISSYPDFDVTLKLRKRPSSDMDVFDQIYNYHEYKPVAETFQKHFPNHKTLNFIDAGSNVGLTSVYFSKLFPDSRFITIEPDASNFETMSYNLSSNAVNVVESVKGGLWSTNSYLKIIHDFRDKKDWSFRVEETSEATDLQAFSVNYLMEKYRFETIDILKIDIEGSEKEVLTSPNADVSYLAKTKCIAIEIHDEFDCREAIYEVLRKYHFEFFNSGELTIGINQTLLERQKPTI